MATYLKSVASVHIIIRPMTMADVHYLNRTKCFINLFGNLISKMLIMPPSYNYFPDYLLTDENTHNEFLILLTDY